MRTMRVVLVLALGTLAASAAFCAEEKIGFVSYGDAAEGRKAFLALKCTECHRVLADPDLPVPTGPVAPVLGGLNAVHSTEELSQAMANPSHSMAPGFEANADGTSPMLDVSRRMTVRQLIDIVAYLKDSQDSDVPWPKEGR